MAAPRPNTYSKAGGVRRRQPEPLRRQRTKISSAHNARGSASRAKAERFSTSRSERPSAVSWPLSPSQSSKNESRGLQREKRALHSEHARRLSFLKASSHWRTESGKCGPREEWPAVPGSDRIRAYLGGWFRHYPLGCYRSAAQFTGSTELLFYHPAYRVSSRRRIGRPISGPRPRKRSAARFNWSHRRGIDPTHAEGFRFSSSCLYGGQVRSRWKTYPQVIHTSSTVSGALLSCLKSPPAAKNNCLRPCRRRINPANSE